ncbi:MAG: ABC transporter substrate-binding protein [Campylobacterales bacterium]
MRVRTMKKISLFALVLVVVVAFFSLFVIEEEHYKIGFVAGLTGKYSNMGVEKRNGFVLAIEEINQSGGIDGKKIVYEIRDDENSPVKIKNIINDFSKNGYNIVVGPSTSYLAKEALATINSHKDMVVISPTVSSIELSGLDDNFIRLDNTYYKNSMKLLVNHIYSKNSDTNTTLLIYDTTNPTYATKWADEFKQEFEKRGGTILIEGVDGSSSFLEDVERMVVQNEFDSVVLILNASNTALIAQKLHIVKPTPLYSAGWALSNELISDGGEAVEGLVIMTTFNPFSKNIRFLEFKKRYQEVYKQEPSSFATGAYDSVMFIKEALQKNSNISNLKDTIIDIGSFEGVNKEVVIDRYGDLDNPESVILEVEGGEFVKAKP